MLILAGRGRFSSAFLAGILLTVVPSYITNPVTQEYLPLALGAGAILVAVTESLSGTGPRTALPGRRSTRTPVRSRRGRARPEAAVPVIAA